MSLSNSFVFSKLFICDGFFVLSLTFHYVIFTSVLSTHGNYQCFFFLISMTLFFILCLFLVLFPKCSIMFSVCFLFTLSLNILQVLKLPWVVLFSIILKVYIFLLFSLCFFSISYCCLLPVLGTHVSCYHLPKPQKGSFA